MFKFTISDLGTFLNKSPATIRSWERKGMITLPREGNNRVLTAREVGDVARLAQLKGRISMHRLIMVCDAVEILHAIELEKK